MKKIALLLVWALVIQMMPINTGTVWAAVETSSTSMSDSTEITSEIIPDETLLNCIKRYVGKNPESTVTYGEIKGITELDYPEESTYELGWKPIESLEGIGILTKLYSLNVTGHNITDLTPLSETGSIYSLWAEDNKISKMPDFSDKSMSAFYVDRNRLDYDTLSKNMPSNWKQYAENKAKYQVPETVGTLASDKYYEVLDKDGKSYYPIVLASTNIRTSREYSLKSVTVNGEDKTNKFELKTSSRSAAPDEYNFDCPYVYVTVTDGDFLDVSKELSIKAVIKDEYDETFTLETTCLLEPFQNTYEIKVENTEFISTTGVMKTGIKLDYKSFFTKEESVTVSKVEFADQDGTVYGTLNNGQSYDPYSLYDYRYENEEIRFNCESTLWTMTGSYTNVCQTMFSPYSNIYIRQELPEGFYDLIYTLSDGTKYIYKKAYEAVTRPIIYRITDTDSTIETNDAVLTDQMGDYVSVYVYGWNISKDTVKPVFYNANDEAISGDVKAVETDKWGGYFRIEKTNPNSSDWDIPLSNDDSLIGSKNYTVKVKTEAELYEKKVSITRRDIFYQYYDHRDKSFTVYLGEKADADITSKPSIVFEKYMYDETEGEYGYVPVVTVENGTFTEKVNPLTNEKETKVKFIFTEEQITAIQEDNYNLYYRVLYKDSDGYEKTHRSDYLAKHAQDGYSFEDVPEKGIFTGYDTNVFYLPYWIGGVYSIASNDEECYYLTKEDVTALSDGKYAYASLSDEYVTMDETPFEQRSYYYYFMKEGVPPVKPVGEPVLSVEKNDGKYRFSWTEVSGANGYSVCFKYGNAEINFENTNELYYEIEAEMLPMIFMEFFEECRENADESKMEIYVLPKNQEDGAIANGDKSNVFTVAGIKGSGNNGEQPPTPTQTPTPAPTQTPTPIYTPSQTQMQTPTQTPSPTQTHTHTTKSQITKAKDGYNGCEITKCTSCNETIKETIIYAPSDIEADDITYNGKQQTPNIVVKDIEGKVIDKSNYKVSKVKNVGDNKITITFLDSSKYYEGTISMKVRVNPKGTSLSKVVAKKKRIVVKWKKQRTQTKGYQIQYSTNKNFKSNVKIITINNKKTSYTIKKLKAKKKYYVRIRTYKGKCCSSWSKKKSAKTK